MEKGIPIGAYVVVCAIACFYLVCTALGFYENLGVRILMAGLFVPAIFYAKDKPLSRLQKVYWELAIATALPLLNFWLFLANEQNVYWSVGMVFCGIFYGIMSGKLYYDILVYPFFAAGGFLMYALQWHPDSAFLWSGVGAFVMSWFACIGFGTLRLAGDIFYKVSVDLNSERYRTSQLEILRQVAVEKLEMERELHRSQRLSSIGTLAGGVAHDFNNQLTVIMGCAEVLKLMATDTDERDLVNNIYEAARHSAKLTRRLLSFASLETSDVKPVDVLPLIEEALTLVRRSAKQIEIVQDYSADVSTILGESSGLANALVNLCVNATHAMPKGGVLTVRTSNTFDPEGWIPISSPRIDSQGTVLVVDIEDTGHGMSDETVALAFEPFYTTKEAGHGTGLGLALVKGTVEGHQGEVYLRTEVDVGTTFRLVLPAVPGLSCDPEDDSVLKGEGTILILDDETLVRVTAEVMLESLGYAVISFSKGNEAVEYFAAHNQEVDLVVLDVIMPGMSGPEVFAKLRKIDPEVRILIASGYSAPGVIEEMMGTAFTDYVHKPFKLSELSTKVRDTIGDRGVPLIDELKLPYEPPTVR